jgi:protein-S-isoprenylcysteine O-methyltransferase Ste14
MPNLFRAALRPTILNMVAKVYIPVLFPLTVGIGVLALSIDRWMEWQAGFLPVPANLGIAASSFVVAALLWLWTYDQLTRLGDGSPSPTAGRTQRLVRTGIYAHSRNPSLFGKLLGVLSVGFALNSVAFCFILIPMLLVGSLFEKVWRQEPQLVEIFGEEYEHYRADVPLFIPWKLIVPKRFRTFRGV